MKIRILCLLLFVPPIVLQICACTESASPSRLAESPANIYGGVVRTDTPHVGALLNINTIRSFCTATLISPTWVITAAHCLNNHTPTDVLFSNSTEAGELGTPTYSVRQFVVHPEYQADSFVNDLALIELNAPVEDATPATLPTAISDTDILNDPPLFIGYGYDEYRVSGIRKAAEIQIESVGNATFTGRYNEELETGACFGDSGGAVVTSLTPYRELLGVISNIISTSSSDPCIGAYNVTRIDTYLPWITATAQLSPASCAENEAYCFCPEACMPSGQCDNRQCQSLTCENLYDCILTCVPGDGACINDCNMSTIAAELTLYEAFVSCGETNCSDADSDELFDCLFTDCFEPFHQCFRASNCNLLGGDCTEQSACAVGRFGLTACISSQGLSLGSPCTQHESTSDCADGYICENQDNEFLCLQLCQSDTDCGNSFCRTDDFTIPGVSNMSVCQLDVPHAIHEGCSFFPSGATISPRTLFSLFL
ncbi:MAG: trypsin-like serine protease [Deltaproteobacteria bacterium]|nr:trypsin-like serine protease [Deltaproteobacteria bacterium]MBN2670711.1 trypsin-like serine protease [Deltaproteobacteria bacterium]